MHDIRPVWALVVIAAAWLAGNEAHAQTLSGEALIEALRTGGYVLVMRHAHSPRQPPTADTASPGNDNLERQLSETGRHTATAMGETLRAAWLRAKAATPPPIGNTVMVTHAPNVTGAFGDSAIGMGDGETLVVRPDAMGSAAVVARVGIEDWLDSGTAR
jgi:hypothetical protein